MKTSPLLFVFAAAFAATLVSSARAAAAVGAAAPDFALTGIDGKTHRLSDYPGKTIVLEWNNPECPFVRKHYYSGNIPGLQKTATADGVVWLMINSGAKGEEGGGYSDAALQAFLDRTHAAPTEYLLDPTGKVGRMYGAKTTPHLFVINADGALVYDGAIDSIRSADVDDIPRARNYVRAALDDLKAGRPVKPAATQPYGCAVKY
ncbi:MAG TPA: redoxin domain-containing protein [Opitutus sp.]|nr:redoxin domain-containing protein [Opitutus sp.]